MPVWALNGRDQLQAEIESQALPGPGAFFTATVNFPKENT